ncbi:MAG: type VI secretion system contractile sheath large subunit [Phycisphaerae bacterium]
MPLPALSNPGLERFLATAEPVAALAAWDALTRCDAAPPDAAAVLASIRRAIAEIDRLLTRQVNAILHHPQFQRLEAAWRGVRHLIDRTEGEHEQILIRVLSVRWTELARDFDRATEVERSALFQKVYDEEFGQPGGIPYSVLIGDYQVRLRPDDEQPTNDLDVLRSIAQVGSAAFAPFITSVHPSFLGLDRFDALGPRLNLERRFASIEYAAWHRLRREADAKFIGLVAPRVLLRRPYAPGAVMVRVAQCGACGTRLERGSGACATCGAAWDVRNRATYREARRGFRFEEDVCDPRGDGYLWGNAAFAFGGVLIRAFLDHAWLADIRGFQRDTDAGGIVSGLPADEFGLDSPGVVSKFSTDVRLDERFDREVSEHGLIPLCHCHDTPFSVFYSNRSIHVAERYASAAEDMNARMTAMLQYTLCLSRFAHYVKVLGRDKIGSRSEVEQIQSELSEWLHQYVTADSQASAETKARHPLREADVAVKPVPGKPGMYQCQMKLWPHFQLDELAFAVRLVTTARGLGT